MDNDHAALVEMAVLGAVISDPEKWGQPFLERITQEHFGGDRRVIAKTLAMMLREGKPVSAAQVVHEIRRLGVYTDEVMNSVLACRGEMSPAPEADFAALGRVFLSREMWLFTGRVREALPTMEALDVLGQAEAELTRLRKIATGQFPTKVTTLADLLAEGIPPIDWVIPNLLTVGTPVMLTAVEGAGKSTVLRPLAIRAICGLDPFTPGLPRTDPKRVLLVDCEVSHGQLTRSLSALWAYAQKFAEDADPFLLRVESRQRGWDLSHGEHQAELLRMVHEHQPDLLIVTPTYRLTEGDLNTEEGCRSWQRMFEPLLASGISFLTEHHAPNGQTGQPRDLRPIGSSVLRRWFAVGLALRGQSCDQHDDKFCRWCQRRVRVEHWRGPRDEVEWPTALRSAHNAIWWLRDDAREHL